MSAEKDDMTTGTPRHATASLELERLDETAVLLEDDDDESGRSGSGALSMECEDPLTSQMARRRRPPVVQVLVDLCVRLRQGRLPRPSRGTVIAVLPSYLSARLYAGSPGAVDAEPPKVYSTTYLDGLRGVASLFVFFFHSSAMIFSTTLVGYGNGDNRYIMQLPFLKLLYQGSSMVSLFFVVSGFALSIAPVKHMRNKDSDRTGLLRSLASAVFRRPFRLYLPPFLSTIVTFLFLRLGIYEATRSIVEATDPAILTGAPFFVMNRHTTLWTELKDWLYNMWSIIEIMNTGTSDSFQPNNRYNQVVWTIPLEFRASVLLYLVHLATSQLKPRIRMSIVVFLMAYSIASNRWEMILFLGGFFLAELDAIVAAQDANAEIPLSRKRPWTIFFILNFVSGLYLCSYPSMGAISTPGFRTLGALVPPTYTRKHRFWEGIGSLQVVLAVSRLPALARFFSTPVVAYLGKISFALYLVHWWIVQTFGVFTFGAVYGILGKSNDFQLYLGFAISLCIIAFVVFWVADLFERYVDVPCVKFAKWLEAQCVRR